MPPKPPLRTAPRSLAGLLVRPASEVIALTGSSAKAVASAAASVVPPKMSILGSDARKDIATAIGHDNLNFHRCAAKGFQCCFLRFERNGRRHVEAD